MSDANGGAAVPLGRGYIVGGPDDPYRIPGEPTALMAAHDLLRLAHSAVGSQGILDWLAGDGLVFCRSDGEYPSGKRWRFFAGDQGGVA